jgi:catalase
MNRPAQSFRSESVTADGAMRNTHMHKQGGVTRWARQDSNLTSENTPNDIENAENNDSSIECVATKKTTQGGTECAPVENKSEQFSQLLQAFNALTPDERSALLEALGGAVKSLQL